MGLRPDCITSECARPGLLGELEDMHPDGKTAALNRNMGLCINCGAFALNIEKGPHHAK
tara:strand:- start:322 stop:498 length:177 start_codon:yes stop_codon:yes gene_type:complete